MAFRGKLPAAPRVRHYNRLNVGSNMNAHNNVGFVHGGLNNVRNVVPIGKKKKAVGFFAQPFAFENTPVRVQNKTHRKRGSPSSSGSSSSSPGRRRERAQRRPASKLLQMQQTKNTRYLRRPTLSDPFYARPATVKAFMNPRRRFVTTKLAVAKQNAAREFKRRVPVGSRMERAERSRLANKLLHKNLSNVNSSGNNRGSSTGSSSSSSRHSQYRSPTSSSNSNSNSNASSKKVRRFFKKLQK